jgi:taurine dioxygenase
LADVAARAIVFRFVSGLHQAIPRRARGLRARMRFRDRIRRGGQRRLHIIQAQYRYDHPWRIGDILLWDNRCLIQSVNVDFPVGERRLHQRILLKGERPA